MTTNNANWTCQLDSLDFGSVGLPSSSNQNTAPQLVEDIKGLTVGKKFRLICDGSPTEQTLKNENLRFDFGTPKESIEPFKLKLLAVNSINSTHGDFIVTSYLVGDHQAVGISLTDGATNVPLTGFTWHVQSVIQTKDGEKAQPYGAFGPIKLIFSWSLIALVLILILVGVWVAVRTWRKIRVRKIFLKEVARYRTARPPIDELFKEMRGLDRAFDFSKEQTSKCIQEIDHVFRLFLIREFTVPALQWGMSNILRELKRNARDVHAETSRDLQKTLVELSRAKGRDSLSSHDVRQIATLVRDTADKMAKIKVARRSEKGISS